MSGSVTVGVTSVLIVEPGAKVFAASSASLVVRGILKARGTADATIVFDATDSASAWGGIEFRSGKASTAQTSPPYAVDHTASERAVHSAAVGAYLGIAICRWTHEPDQTATPS